MHIFKLAPLFLLVFCFGFKSLEEVPKDPMNVKIYTLDNGLKVYFSVNKKSPTIKTYIAVKAGSKNDPADTTGLAHYFEHLMFKGSENFGTVNYSKEKPFLDKIEQLFEAYRQTDDEAKRNALYNQIDAVSQEAAKFAIPNEYDQMITSLGATGTNAYTSNEKTVYVNTIPSNQIANWLHVEFDRFSKPVIRLFHSELETVYEEKTISLDKDSRRKFEALLRSLFPKHQYGTQTTLGSIKDLKNPSITNVKKFYETYYVPNNMAIVMAGDFEPESTLKLIEESFGTWKRQPIPNYQPPVEEPIKSVKKVDVVGPEQESVILAWRFSGADSVDADKLVMLDMMLSNGNAGLIDQNINQKQRVLGAFSSPFIMADYSALLLGGSPTKGQSLEDVEKILLEQINEVKQGKFADWLPEAVVNNFKVDTIASLENNESRANIMLDSFTLGIAWPKMVNKLDRLGKITKVDLVKFANENLADNYVVVYKRKGEFKLTEKISQPKVTPIKIDNTKKHSQFYTDVTTAKVKPIKPEFVDLDKVVDRIEVSPTRDLYYKKNSKNDLFELTLKFDVGNTNFPSLSYATSYLNYLGTETMSMPKLKEEMYRLGCSYSISAGAKSFKVNISGLTENLDAAVALVVDVLHNPKSDDKMLALLINRNLKVRQDSKSNKDFLFKKALQSYVKYGKNNAITADLSNEELQALKSTDLLQTIKSVITTPSKLYFYGPTEAAAVQTIYTKLLPGKDGKKIEPLDFIERQTGSDLYFLNVEGMKQVRLMYTARSDVYSPDTMVVRSVFNDYFGLGMSSIIFQQLRESQALAYTAYAYYSSTSDPKNHHYSNAYIGTQPEKLEQAMKAFEGFFATMPREDYRYENAIKSSVKQLESSRVTESGVLGYVQFHEKMDLKEDSRKTRYRQLKSIKLDDIMEFHKRHFSNSKFDLIMMGDKTKFDLKKVAGQRKIIELTLKDLLPY